MAHLRSPFFQAQSRFQHAHSNSVTLSVLSFYDSAPESEDPVASSSAPTTPAAGSSTVQSSSSTHRRTASALPGSASSSIRKVKQHRRNSAISKRSTSLPVPQPLVSSSLAETPDVGPASATAALFEFAPPPVLTLSPPPEAAKKPRRSAPRLRVANPSITSSTRRRTPAPSFVQPLSPPPPYSLYPSQSTRQVHVPNVGRAPTLPSSPSPYLRDVYTASPRAGFSTFPINRSGDIPPRLRTSQVRPLPSPPSVPRPPSPQDSESDDPERRPSLPLSESGLSTTSTSTESESIHPFDSDEEEEQEDVVNIRTPSRDEQFDHLDSFLEFSSCSSSLSSGATTGPSRLPRKYTAIPIVGTFDPTEPEYSRGTLGAGLRKQCKRIVATGKTKLVAVGRKRSGSTESVESALSSQSRDLDWADALEGTLFG
ncbi:hypothetical protein FS837_009466 [Tulasnella sp. UAMH 9824]|nr:hypothetical protein FS837_009466 [Tulasnella sp. UAMH 9824]